MCDYVEEAIFEDILQERNLERKRLYLARCLQKMEEVQRDEDAVELALTVST